MLVSEGHRYTSLLLVLAMVLVSPGFILLYGHTEGLPAVWPVRGTSRQGQRR